MNAIYVIVVVVAVVLAFCLGPHAITGWLENRRNFPAIGIILGIVGVLAFIVKTLYDANITWGEIDTWQWIALYGGIAMVVVAILWTVIRSLTNHQPQVIRHNPVERQDQDQDQNPINI